MALDMTSFDAALKVRYTDEEVERLTYQDHPLLALVAKKENFTGKNLPIPIIYGNPQGRSATFSEAQGNQTSSKIEDFVLTRAKDYAVASIDGETWDASEDDPGAFMEAMETEFDGAFESIGSSLATALYRSGTGSIGRVAQFDAAGADTEDGELILVDIEDIVHFEVGMTVRGTSTDGGAYDTGEEVIAGVDRDAGMLIATSATWATVMTDLATNDFLVVSGDLNAKIKGLDAWMPATVTSASFFGVDRTLDSTRLGGCRYDAATPGDTLEEALINGATKSAREGGKISHYFMSYERLGELSKLLGTKREYVQVNASAEISFPAYMVQGPKGPIKVIADQDCQPDIAWGLDMRRWKLYSLKKCPRILMRDGSKTLRQSTADAEEFRVGYYAQLGCRAPGHNVRVTLPS